MFNLDLIKMRTYNGFLSYDFASVWSRISFERAFDNEVLLESLSLSFERIRHFGPKILSV